MKNNLYSAVHEAKLTGAISIRLADKGNIKPCPYCKGPNHNGPCTHCGKDDFFVYSEVKPDNSRGYFYEHTDLFFDEFDEMLSEFTDEEQNIINDLHTYNELKKYFKTATLETRFDPGFYYVGSRKYVHIDTVRYYIENLID